MVLHVRVRATIIKALTWLIGLTAPGQGATGKFYPALALHRIHKPGEAAVKSAMRQSKPGLTLVEIVMGIVILSVLAAIAIPAFYTMLQRSQLDAGVRQVMSDVREAQSRATLTGWQVRLIGFNYSSTDAKKNQYRLVARSSSAVAWPVATVDPFGSVGAGTQMAGTWFDVNKQYPGVRFNPASASPNFYVSFDSRGVAFEWNAGIGVCGLPPCWMDIVHDSGAKKQLSVTTAGSVRVQ